MGQVYERESNIDLNSSQFDHTFNVIAFKISAGFWKLTI